MVNSSQALQVIVPSGKPNGLKIISSPGWSGRCLMVPRQNIRELRELDDNNKPGLYILFGQDEDTGKKIAYIGESENFFSRISNHDSHKDFWDSAVIFTGDLNRAYVKYLEHRATLLASEAKRMEMQNKIQPQENSLSDYDALAVNQYFEYVKFILSTFNYELFERLEESIKTDSLYYLKGNHFEASAQLLDNGNMMVLAGSLASIKESNSFGGWSKQARMRFLQEGTLKQHDDHSYQLVQDMVFRSPSAAAATFSARSINGWTAWKDSSGKTLDQNLRQNN